MDTRAENDGDAVKPATPRWMSYFGKTWLQCSLLALLGFASHAPALPGQLIWDDQYLARDNPFIKSPILALEAFRHYLFLDSFSGHYRPVQNLSFILDYVLWNTNTFGFHLTNVLLHIASGVLLYFLVRRLLVSLGPKCFPSRSGWIPLAVSAIWIVHPVHSAAVDYISGRADSLAFLFASAAWLLYFKAGEVRSGWRGLLLGFAAFVSGLLALCSRETGLIWLAIFLLYTLVFDRMSRGKAKAILAAACLLLLSVYAGLRQLPEQRPGPGPSTGWTGPVRGVLMLRALGDYTRLMIFPSKLHMERTVFSGAVWESEKGREEAIELEYLSILGGIVALSLGACLFWRTPWQRLRIFGAAWFLLAYLPTSNLFDLNATVAEHWLYLPSVGLLILLAGSAVEFGSRKTWATVVTLAVLALAGRSFYRSGDWVDPETFYTRTAAAGGTSCRVSVNLAQIYATKGDYARAEVLFRRVLAFQPDYIIARNNLADCLAHLGREKEAEQALKDATTAAHESRKDYPRTWIAAANLARMFDSRGDIAGAVAVLRKAQADYPNTWELISYESELLRQENKPSDAAALIAPYARANWWHYASWMALGRLEAEQGDVENAESALRHASWLDIRSTEPLNLIALIRVGQNRLEDAVHAQRRAVARQPEQPRQYILLSNILDKMGRTGEAHAALAEVSRLRSLAGADKAVN